MARILRSAAGCIAGLIMAVCLGVLVPRPLVPPSHEAAPRTRQVLVLSNPIHTDLALPLDRTVRDAFADLVADGFPLDTGEGTYLVIGWGGRSFYLETPEWSDLEPLPVLRSLTVDRAVMHVDLAADIALDHPQVRTLDLTEDGYRRLLSAIRGNFSREEGRLMMIEGAGYGFVDRFYEAEGLFNALIGCNTWTAAMLREAGITTGFWTPLPRLLELSLEVHAGDSG